jgi:hypothetical protein
MRTHLKNALREQGSNWSAYGRGFAALAAKFKKAVMAVTGVLYSLFQKHGKKSPGWTILVVLLAGIVVYTLAAGLLARLGGQLLQGAIILVVFLAVASFVHSFIRSLRGKI